MDFLFIFYGKKMKITTFFIHSVNKVLQSFRFHIMGTDETITHILTTNDSIVRYGDGEMALMLGHDIHFQRFDVSLKERLAEILGMPECKGLKVGIPMAINSTEELKKQAADFWQENLKTGKMHWVRFCNWKKIYINSSFTWCYVDYDDKEKALQSFLKVISLWDGKDVLIVEGEASKLGVNNGLFMNAKSVKRIICPSKNAYDKYEEILEKIKILYHDELLLISLGPTATVLAYDIYKMGKRAIDIGHLNNEYQEYLEDLKIKEEKILSENEYQNQIIGKVL